MPHSAPSPGALVASIGGRGDADALSELLGGSGKPASRRSRWSVLFPFTHFEKVHVLLRDDILVTVPSRFASGPDA